MPACRRQTSNWMSAFSVSSAGYPSTKAQSNWCTKLQQEHETGSRLICVKNGFKKGLATITGFVILWISYCCKWADLVEPREKCFVCNVCKSCLLPQELKPLHCGNNNRLLDWSFLLKTPTAHNISSTRTFHCCLILGHIRQLATKVKPSTKRFKFGKLCCPHCWYEAKYNSKSSGKKQEMVREPVRRKIRDYLGVFPIRGRGRSPKIPKLLWFDQVIFWHAKIILRC